ncbi:hypothetical protein TNIN_484191 [Trichonephila inaurata madagascariensis]|uniref:Uncharacterized protein n=1 Tax=Trichonephila inaurata madagascariensis TaxID=2747483 RepID=A0A8X6JBC0_9ARAC|nr:hypothetical protein TNIN_484191 [Trichonephila inaurata madagascariensis]
MASFYKFAAPHIFSVALEEFYRESGYSLDTAERWRTCINRINTAFGMVSAFLYVKEHFSIDVRNEGGFRQYRSTSQHVTLLSQSGKDAMDKKIHFVSCICGSVKSAYDLVWRESIFF